MPIQVGEDLRWREFQQQRMDSAFSDLISALSRRKERKMASYYGLAEHLSQNPELATDDLLGVLRSSGDPALGAFSDSLGSYRTNYESSMRSAAGALAPQRETGSAASLDSVPGKLRDSGPLAEPEGLIVPRNDFQQTFEGADLDQRVQMLKGLGSLGFSSGDTTDLVRQKMDPQALAALPQEARGLAASGRGKEAEQALKYQAQLEPSPEEQQRMDETARTHRQQEEDRAKINEVRTEQMKASTEASRALIDQRRAKAEGKGKEGPVKTTWKDEAKAVKDELEASGIVSKDKAWDEDSGKEVPVPPEDRKGLEKSTADVVAAKIGQIRKIRSASDGGKLNLSDEHFSADGVKQAFEKAASHMSQQEANQAVLELYKVIAEIEKSEGPPTASQLDRYTRIRVRIAGGR